MQTIVSLVCSDLAVARIPASRHHLGGTGVVSRRLRESGPSTEIGFTGRAAATRPARQRFPAAVRDAVPERSGPG